MYPPLLRNFMAQKCVKAILNIDTEGLVEVTEANLHP